MSFSFPHLVWIFQKAFSGLSYFETLIWLMIDVVTIGLLPLGLLDVHRFRVWRAALWEILSFLLLLPHCHSQLGHHYLTYLKQWSSVLRMCYTWWMMIFSNTTLTLTYSSIHSPTTQESGHCPAVLSLFLIQIHIHTYPRGMHHLYFSWWGSEADPGDMWDLEDSWKWWDLASLAEDHPDPLTLISETLT